MDRSAWIGSEGLPRISPSGEKEGKEPHFAHRRREQRGAALLDNPPLVPLQLPNSWQGFAIAAVSRGFPSVLQTEAWSTPSSSRSALCVQCQGCWKRPAGGLSSPPRRVVGAAAQNRTPVQDSSSVFCFLATFRARQGSTLDASCPGEVGAGTSAAGGRIHLSAGFSLDPSLDLIRHSSQ